MEPLAERLRPQSVEDYIGQAHLMGPGGVIRQMIASNHIPSMIFWGPPGVGKTSLAHVISKSVKRPFYALSAINSGVKDVREVILKAKSGGMFAGTSNPIVFIDEIHRFSKSQQDSLLGAVEQGVITLIGATTENPSFEVISALLSRSQVYVLKEHSVEELAQFLALAQKKDAKIAAKKIKLEGYDKLLQLSGGDARRLLNNFELITDFLEVGSVVNDEVVDRILKTNPILFDKGGDQHYDLASALIKSIRGSDPDAAVYYLARMIEGGEDPKFIARRLLISASEDIGLANPSALALADSCFQAVEKIGYPEARIILSQTTLYLATSPKSNAAYLAIDKALDLVRKTGAVPVPMHLRNAPTKLMKQLGHGEDYRYSHDYPGNFVVQAYLPTELSNNQFYLPGDNPKEREIRKRLQGWWGRRFE